MADHKLQQKTIVITGASGGIGSQMALLAASLGAVPILVARSVDKLQALSADIYEQYRIEADYYALDVSDVEAVSRTFAEIQANHPPIDVLINNAGFGVFDHFHEARMDDVKKMIDVNVVGLMACTREIMPQMMDRRQGHIINVASVAGKLATPKSIVYSSSKHAVLGFSNGLRMELDGTGIHVTTVNPGPIRTNFFNIADPDGVYLKNVNRFLLEPDQVAKAVMAAIRKPRREVNLPKYMNIGTTLYNLVPGLIEKTAGKLFKMK
ncbi:SDR family NAD(P)-dependent oxidoreductase [Tuberibacillus sp. Marseille-P3662]|uniref:SDR family NAD(P)-dependent oxidoreductase n=1 Tax=Tuberibacillus sp. Marseille-P3662 TaxID=1965358 RepID=UPI000A1CC0C2|nr:SDR family oxidoreductase [Tuberibacillus sp. Marseille-P3662]